MPKVKPEKAAEPGQKLADVVRPGTIVKTSYNTGPYVVFKVGHDNLTCVGPEVWEPTKKKYPDNALFWLNDLSVRDGRIFSVRGDEVVIVKSDAADDSAPADETDSPAHLKVGARVQSVDDGRAGTVKNTHMHDGELKSVHVLWDGDKAVTVHSDFDGFDRLIPDTGVKPKRSAKSLPVLPTEQPAPLVTAPADTDDAMSLTAAGVSIDALEQSSGFVRPDGSIPDNVQADWRSRVGEPVKIADTHYAVVTASHQTARVVYTLQELRAVDPSKPFVEFGDRRFTKEYRSGPPEAVPLAGVRVTDRYNARYVFGDIVLHVEVPKQAYQDYQARVMANGDVRETAKGTKRAKAVA